MMNENHQSANLGLLSGGWLWLVLASLMLGGMALIVSEKTMRLPEPTPAVTAPLRIETTPWQLGAAVTLTLQSNAGQAGQVISITLLAPGADPPHPAPHAPEFYGMSGVQLLWLPPEDQETEIALAAAAGAESIGLDFDWRRIETEPGQYDWAETDRVVALARRYRLRLVPMLLYTPRWASSAPFAPLDYFRAPPVDHHHYRNFVYAVVSRYKPYGESPLTAEGYGITDWIIWNEPNVQTGGQEPQPADFWLGSLEAYVQLLRAGYEGVHAADPSGNVLNGALADIYWQPGELDLVTSLERFYDPNGDGDAADGGRPFFDTLNIHTYQGGRPTAAWYRERLATVSQVMARFGDAQKPIWITETGYGSIARQRMPAQKTSEHAYVDEATQAEAVRLVYETVAAYPQVERLFWWNLRDYYYHNGAGNPAMEAHYGLLRANFEPKPAYLAYARLTGRPVRRLTARLDELGQAQVTAPASFISQMGDYTVLVTLDGDSQATVTTYRPAPKE